MKNKPEPIALVVPVVTVTSSIEVAW